MLMNTVMHMTNMTCSLEVKIQMTIDWMILSPFLPQKQLCVLQYLRDMMVKVIEEMVMSDRAGRRNDVQEFIIYYIYIY